MPLLLPTMSLILACNDYLHKVKEFRKMPQVDDEICQNLISSTIRIKAWTYKTIVRFMVRLPGLMNPWAVWLLFWHRHVTMSFR